MHEWNYHDDDPVFGPSEWARRYPAVGAAQSPIDIQIDYCDLQRFQKHRSSCSSDKLLSANEVALRQLQLSGAKKHHRDHLNSTGGEEYDADNDDDAQREHTSLSAKSPCSPTDDADSHQSKAASNRLDMGDRVNQNTTYCATNKKLFLGYPRYLNSVKLCNTGHAWQIDMSPELGAHTLLCGPPLGDREYRLAQLHCHWGTDCDQGSEHLVNGRAYSAEIHFVHWNCKDFKTFEEAARHKHGLAVLGVFVQALEGEENRNKHLDKICAALPKINERPHSCVLLDDFRLDLKKLFPTNRWLYVSYEGSLTTPPLSEVVDWIVFLQPIQCSRRQIETFRQLSCSPQGEKLRKNCRPVQPINQRLVSIWTHGNP